jgi:hypothetical protein
MEPQERGKKFYSKLDSGGDLVGDEVARYRRRV